MSTSEESNAVVRSGPRPAIRVLAILVVLGVAVTGAVWIVKPPKYRAEARIQVISPNPRTPMVLTDTQITTEVMNRYVSDQAVLLKDEIVLRGVLQDPTLRATRWYQAQPDAAIGLQAMKCTLTARPIRDSSYLEVSLVADHPKDAAIIVNTVIEKYMAQVQLGPQRELAEELKSYQEQEDRLAGELKRILEERQRFLQEQFGTPGLTQGVNVVGETLRAMTARVTELEQEKLQAKVMYDNLTQADPWRTMISLDMIRAVEQDPEVASLRDLKLSLEIESEAVTGTQPESRPAGDMLHSKLKVVERKLVEVMARKEKELRDYQVNAAHTALLNAMQEELALRERLVEVEAKQRDIEQGVLRFQNLEERQKQVEKQLEQIREYMNQLQLVIKDRNPVRVRRLGMASVPEERDMHFQVAVSLGAMAVPLVYGILLALVRIARGPRRAAGG